MELSLNEKGNIELDLYAIITEVIGKATEEEMVDIVECFGLQKPIRRWMVERLADDYSRPCFNESIHDDRLKLLQSIKVEELKYYADLIVDKMVDEHRHNKAYWELYHWCQNHDVNKIEGFPYNSLRPSNTDWTKELRETVETIIKEKRPDLLEPKYNEPDKVG